jgi:hypothetical protein
MDGGDERESSPCSPSRTSGALTVPKAGTGGRPGDCEELESALLCAERRAAGVCTAVRGAACGGRAIALLIVSSALR